METREVIAKFDSLCLMVIWILDNPEFSDVTQYPTEIVGSEYFIVKGK